MVVQKNVQAENVLRNMYIEMLSSILNLEQLLVAFSTITF